MLQQRTFRIATSIVFIVPFFFGLASFAAPVDNNTDSAVEVWVEKVGYSAMNVTVEVTDYEIDQVCVDDDVYDCFSIGSEPTINEEGLPDLPFISRAILIPPHGDVQLEVINVESEILHDLRPVITQENIDLTPEKFTPCEGLYPPEPVVLGEPAILRGYRLINFRFYPMQFNSSTGEMVINERITLHFEFTGNGDNDLSYSSNLRPSIYAYRAVKNLVLNPPDPPSRDDLLSASYMYIVPRYDGVDERLAPLIEWRRRQGHKVRVEHVPNNVESDAVYNLIENAYNSENPVEFVALVGDASGGAFNVSAYTRDGDYNYSRVDGNDPLPDVAIGRISCRNLDDLSRIVNKLVTYESDPYMEETDWFIQGAVVAGHRGNGLGTILVARYVRKELLNLGFTEVRHWYHNEDGEISGNQPFVTDAFEWGISVLHYRAYQHMNGLPLNVINDLPNRNGRWPIVLAISCNTGDFVGREGYTEAFLRARGGGIAAIGTATPGTTPQFNNMMSGGVWKGIYKDGMYTPGWGLNSGKYELWRAYHGFEGAYMSFMDWNNLMGDPGTHIWTDIPREILVDHLNNLSIGESYFNVRVFDAESQSGEACALVCLFKEDDDLHLTCYTDEDGTAEFYIDPDALTDGELMVTVTKHNVHAYLEEIAVEEHDYYLGVNGWTVDDDNEGESRGNEDGVPNPGERIELMLNLANFGTEVPQNEIAVNIQTESQWAQVLAGDIDIEQAPEVGNAVEIMCIIDINPSCPDFEDVYLTVNSTDGETVWMSSVLLDVASPELISNRLNFIGGDLEPGDIRDLDIELRNVGHEVLDACHARIWTESEVLDILQDEADYEEIGIDEASFVSGQRFRLSAQPFTIPGMQERITFQLETEDGFRDTLQILITIGSPEETDPFGPDAYGYVCFDSGDENWQMAPDYDWIEIDPDVDGFHFQGTNLNLDDPSDNRDESRAIDLPFAFQYYGEVFDQITVCTNGWVAFGNQEELADFRNRRIAQALGPNAQLCAWWDNLITADNSAILVHHDEERGRFIVEWSQMYRQIGTNQRGALETFEIILYDPEVNPTYTGDGIITFQYKEITNENRRARNDTPFCTIGISNLDDSDGLEYTYWNTYSPGAKRIENEMTIMFTTATSFITGVIQGTVTDAGTGNPLANAEVRASRGFNAITNNNGFYQFDILIGEDYDLTAIAIGYNDSTLAGFAIAEDETLEVNFALLHSEFELSAQEFHAELGMNESTDFNFNIRNDGNGPLNWQCERSYGEGEAGINRLIGSHIVAQVVNDLQLEGVAFVDDRFYVTGQNGMDPNMIYVLDSDGNLVNRIEQVGDSRVGMLDLTWDGTLLWGSGERYVYGFTTGGELRASFQGPYSNNQALAWDADRELFWIVGSQQNVPIVGVDREGNRIDGMALDSRRMRISGLAYWQEDPDGFNLLVLHNPGQEIQHVHKIDPENDSCLFVKSLEPEYGGQPGGAFITNEYGRYGWVFMTLINDPMNRLGDRIDIWQMGTYKGWMNLNGYEGVVGPESQTDFVLTLDATGLLPALYEGMLYFQHSALGGVDSIGVTLEVYDLSIKAGDTDIPTEFAINTMHPNPFNSSISIDYALNRCGNVFMRVYDLTGREVVVLDQGFSEPGRYRAILNTGQLTSGVYLMRLTMGSETRSAKVVCIK